MTDTKYTRQTITAVQTWVPGKLFSVRVTRDPAFLFQAGQFARVGLPDSDDPQAEPSVWRAYSMVSAPEEPWLEFYSIVVPEGQFSPRMARLQPGDALYVEKKPFGFLTIDRFAPGGDLWLLASGTGLSAYLSILRDPTTWRAFDRIILVHGVRSAEELAYRDEIEQWRSQPAFAPYFEADPRKLIYLPIATRETLPGMPQARLTTLIADGRLEQLAGQPLDPQRAKIMLCGNPAMLADARKLLSERGFAPGRRGIPGNLAVENYW
ncbi:ferredoxin--NADP reductase [Bordetella bronchiseptica]|uniref:ferredoxin--NADP reductase n=1 Tax=Bordetella bronchiseptica TaxID=518 RepID=UPI00045A40BF|nr:ferredoxin--NADP reductase [Bordetella bronchiseptica]KDD53754.1 oxidoreductase NAD-binding domain protein [Bordetella bronchiseptica OSU553]AWQ06586.1 ferredoxin--NADP(+) reductase [Bordetella bronchiseptica]KAK54556.1 oxidoreductase NAD-binding domain protein [Bordetella bronchiseptica OSU054]KDB75395.1 oxidoreductase NAD-binding domain protein [Bordetella bronchiseptica CA90 BB1334]KDC92354.1 oxidoreductase NAD-binding domain protein [Bordetella bronchiseptica MBORD675]